MIYVVTGPPCVGKSTWVRQRATRGDLVVDLDRIALAISTEDTPHHDYPPEIRYIAMQMRKTAVAAALRYGRTRNAYIIHAKPTSRSLGQYRAAGAHIVELTETYDVLIARAKAERPPHIWQTLARWWEEPDE